MIQPPPSDLDGLCADLGVSMKRRARLADDYGDHLIPYLQKLWRWTREQDAGRFLHRHATASTEDYVDDPNMAMWGQDGGEPEAVPEDVQAELTAAAGARGEVLRAKQNRVREIRSLNRRLRVLALEAARCGIDTTPEIESIKTQVASLEGKLKAAA